jgi:hypothetical protein
MWFWENTSFFKNTSTAMQQKCLYWIWQLN